MKKSELAQIIREEIQKIMTEDIGMSDWKEFERPDYVIITLTNGRKIRIDKMKIKGGQKAYDTILTLLRNLDNPKAKQAMNQLVAAMVNNLSK
jgi:hypothetical protein